MCPDENREVAKHLETDANKMVKKREYFIWKMRLCPNQAVEGLGLVWIFFCSYSFL
jgi:hypothetical protein